MKLRIHENSIRFRLTQSEVASLVTARRVEGSVRFAPAPDNLLTYAVEIPAECSDPQARRSATEICVTLPEDLARTWATTSRVSIEHVQHIGVDASLRILVEKDFRCLHAAPDQSESNSDNFPNPVEIAGTQEEP